jgi:hypothetical protein
MYKILRVINIILIVVIINVLKADLLSADYTVSYTPVTNISFQYVDKKLWGYLRLGLNYLESPAPLSEPENLHPTYIHPDLKGFGSYGLTFEAFQDVQAHYPFFKHYRWENILGSPQLYELANQAFADWLIKNLRGYIPDHATAQQVFDVLHKAWNVGLSGYKNGRNVVPSRIKRVEEFYKLTKVSL